MSRQSEMDRIVKKSLQSLDIDPWGFDDAGFSVRDIALVAFGIMAGEEEAYNALDTEFDSTFLEEVQDSLNALRSPDNPTASFLKGVEYFDPKE